MGDITGVAEGDGVSEGAGAEVLVGLGLLVGAEVRVGVLVGRGWVGFLVGVLVALGEAVGWGFSVGSGVTEGTGVDVGVGTASDFSGLVLAKAIALRIRVIRIKIATTVARGAYCQALNLAIKSFMSVIISGWYIIGRYDKNKRI